MAYSIEVNSSGRYIVISPKGKKWKTTYASRQAAEKAVAYVEGRFGGSGSSPRAAPLTSGPDLIDSEFDMDPGENVPDTSAMRKRLGIPPKPGSDEDTEGW